MRKTNLIWMTVICIPALFLEFRNISYDALFYSWPQYFPVVGCIILVVVITAKNIFKKRTSLEAYLPVMVGVASLLIIGIHAWRMKHLKEDVTYFKAVNEEIGSDGGLVLDFKKDGFLMAKKQDTWCSTYYWGSYKKNGDTVTLDMPFNFELSVSAVIKNDSILVFDPAVQFVIFARRENLP